MDEWELASQIIDLVDQAVFRQHLGRVKSVRLAIGGRRHIDIWRLGHTFSLAAKGTVAQQAKLAVELLPVRHHCCNCGFDFESVNLEMQCLRCSHPRTEASSGEELRLLEIETDEPAPSPNST